jgi:sporulation protein YlmC with PRC-barrel domain
MQVAILFQKSKEVAMRQYFYFQSDSDPRLYAFTDDPTSEKLPAESGPWTLVRQMSLDEEWRHPASQAMVTAGVLENGFALWDTALGEGETTNQPPSSKPVIESDRVEGTAVYDTQGKHIGTIKRLVIEKVSGRVVYADMTFGGFLGVGAHHHTIPWDKLNYDTRLGGYRTDITEEQLRDAPALDRAAETWPGREREQVLHDFWRTPPYWRDHMRK